ncbi:MAG TPA: DUF5522 domain-containing protein [Pyrinomonadaceae bacterium]|jgi:hypothetical protein
MNVEPDRRALVEGEDFYREGAVMVFTARYLARRGYCCENGCRHCPYDFRKEKHGDEVSKEQKAG